MQNRPSTSWSNARECLYACLSPGAPPRLVLSFFFADTCFCHTCLMFVLLTLIYPRSFYSAECENSDSCPLVNQSTDHLPFWMHDFFTWSMSPAAKIVHLGLVICMAMWRHKVQTRNASVDRHVEDRGTINGWSKNQQSHKTYNSDSCAVRSKCGAALSTQ